MQTPRHAWLYPAVSTEGCIPVIECVLLKNHNGESSEQRQRGLINVNFVEKHGGLHRPKVS